ncbi:MAG: D-alanyl-D-alanine dipeptidase [Myxococcaceae bacterium]
MAVSAWALVACLGSAPVPALPALIDVENELPDVSVDLRYATPNNFLDRPVYPPHARCFLVKEAADKLARAAEELRALGLRLHLYDCYRPLSVQHMMWELVPKPGYVANPKAGSPHNRGAAVDLTLEKDGQEVEMPTPFDSFQPASHHDNPKATKQAKANRARLRAVMKRAGFVENKMEWWHYELPKAHRFPVLDVGFPLPTGNAASP